MAVKVASLLAGILCLYFGYKLLMRGIFPDTSDKPVWEDSSLLFKRGAPGTVFALFGALLIVVTLVRSGELRSREAAAQVQQTQAPSTDRSGSSAQGKRNDAPQRASRDRVSSRPAPEPGATRHDRASPREESNQPPLTTTKDPGMTARPGRA